MLSDRLRMLTRGRDRGESWLVLACHRLAAASFRRQQNRTILHHLAIAIVLHSTLFGAQRLNLNLLERTVKRSTYLARDSSAVHNLNSRASREQIRLKTLAWLKSLRIFTEPSNLHSLLLHAVKTVASCRTLTIRRIRIEPKNVERVAIDKATHLLISNPPTTASTARYQHVMTSL